MVPVRHEQAAIAAMGAYWASSRQVTPQELELLETVANSAALAIAFVEVQQAPQDGLRKLAAELARSRESERRRIARELHDTTCQDLVAASLAVDRLERALITGFASRAGIKVRFTTKYPGRPSESIERAIIAVVQGSAHEYSPPLRQQDGVHCAEFERRLASPHDRRTGAVA